MQQALDAAEMIERLLGELEHGDAAQSGAQQQRDQLGIGKGAGALRKQLFARAGVGGNVLENHDRVECGVW